MRILFVDPKSSTPYDGVGMRTEGIGGTEATVVRVAQALSATHEIWVEQLGRTADETVDGVHYVPLGGCAAGSCPPDVVIVLRKFKLALRYRRRFPRAALAVWVHNWQRPEAAVQRLWLARAGAALITVSEAHRRATDRLVNGRAARLLGVAALSPARVPVVRIYNPIDDALAPDDTPVDSNRLLYLSTANKGLDQVLRAFRVVRRALPSMELLVAGTPSEILWTYPTLNRELLEQPGVRLLGRLTQQELLPLLRSALCVFYPQSVHPETFGLIFAEANAVGTPVLAHDFGAAREVLNGPEQLVNANDLDAVVDRITTWHLASRPTVSGQSPFRLNVVAREWSHVIEELRA